MQSTTLWCLNEASMSSCTCAIRLPIPLALKREKLLKTQPMQFSLIRVLAHFRCNQIGVNLCERPDEVLREHQYRGHTGLAGKETHRTPPARVSDKNG
jgi:hypothetical protein